MRGSLAQTSGSIEAVQAERLQAHHPLPAPSPTLPINTITLRDVCTPRRPDVNFAPRCAPVNSNTTATECRTQSLIVLHLGRPVRLGNSCHLSLIYLHLRRHRDVPISTLKHVDY